MRERIVNWLLGNVNPKERWIVRKSRDIYAIRDRLASVEGRIYASENSASAANSRCERLETRLRALEHQVEDLNRYNSTVPQEPVYGSAPKEFAANE